MQVFLYSRFLFVDGGVTSWDVLALYQSRARDGLDQIAWNLCGCDDKTQSEKFRELELEYWSIEHKLGDNYRGRGRELQKSCGINSHKTSILYTKRTKYG
jgi:hypothetical protein